MSRLVVLAATGIAAAACVAAQGAAASTNLLVGLFDQQETLHGNPDFAYPLLRSLRTEVIRVTLYWGGPVGVAKRRPFDGADPNDPAYDWSAYDRTISYASQYGIKVLLTIFGTPAWANGGAGLNRAPRSFAELRKFAFAAATRYSGTWTTDEGRPLAAVRRWTAWNEPNNPVFLSPQYKRVGGRWVVQSARDYAKICAAVHAGVHATLIKTQRVACGVTAPRGNNNPSGSRPSVSPIAFLVALKRAGLKRFDVYAHHPYYAFPSETPSSKPAGTKKPFSSAVTLGNIDQLISEVKRLYGPHRLWITEYGYQTRPPDSIFGVSWALQATYLKQGFAIARRNPSIDMMLWFLLKDEPILSGWQSGLMTSAGRRKPAFAAFRAVPR